jgi:predicted transcriptional regulator
MMNYWRNTDWKKRKQLNDRVIHMAFTKFSDSVLLELYHQGLTNKEIADRLQVTQPAVHYRIEKLGLTNNCHSLQDIDCKQVKTLHGLGVTSVGIALLLKTNVQTVSHCLKEMGLQDNYGWLKKHLT